MDEELHKQLKLLAINEDKTMTGLIIELVETEIEAKKEQSR
jgi:hypothetical protein